MMHKEFKVLSSNGVNEYLVTFEWDGNSLHMSCSCKAGILGQFCKHQAGLISGEDSLLHDEEDRREILSWVDASPVRGALASWRNAEANVHAAQTAEKAAKKVLADLVSRKRTR